MKPTYIRTLTNYGIHFLSSSYSHEGQVFLAHGGALGVSYGNLLGESSSARAEHTCSTEHGSTGTPLINFAGQVIAMHLGTRDNRINMCTLIERIIHCIIDKITSA